MREEAVSTAPQTVGSNLDDIFQSTNRLNNMAREIRVRVLGSFPEATDASGKGAPSVPCFVDSTRDIHSNLAQVEDHLLTIIRSL